jgi:hypothetical protein
MWQGASDRAKRFMQLCTGVFVSAIEILSAEYAFCKRLDNIICRFVRKGGVINESRKQKDHGIVTPGK